MPSGYTAEIYDNKDTSFEGYAIRCAHAFGALIDRRDSGFGPLPKSIDKTEEVQRHKTEIEKAERLIKTLKNMSPADKIYHADKYNSERKEHAKKKIDELTVLRDRYLKLLEKTLDWDVPDSLLQLKNFMIKQLNDSIEYDCGVEYYEKMLNPISLDKWYKTELSGAEWNLKYHLEELEKIEKFETKATEFVRDLSKALNLV